MLKRGLAIAGIVLFSFSAQAGLYFEPFVAAALGGTFKGELTADGTPLEADNKLTGGGLGARLGWQFTSFGLGLEYMGGSYTYKQTGSNEETDLDTSDIGFFIRYDMKRVHFYVTAISGSAKDKALQDMGYKESLQGNGSRVGVGFKFHEHLALNVEYYSVSYDKSDNLKLTDIDAKLKATMLGLSFPFATISDLWK